jgi:hypothetical protein
MTKVEDIAIADESYADLVLYALVCHYINNISFAFNILSIIILKFINNHEYNMNSLKICLSTILMLLTTISFVISYIHLAVADTLTTPGHTVTFPSGGESDSNIKAHVGEGAPCKAFSNANNPVTAEFQIGHHQTPLVC